MDTYTPAQLEEKFAFRFTGKEGPIKKTSNDPKYQMHSGARAVIAPDGGWTVHLLGMGRLSVRVKV